MTVAWDISWYQYRVTPGSAQPVRLEERGLELEELDEHLRALERARRARRPRRARDRTRLARRLAPAAFLHTIRSRMIYCVIPRELEGELYDKMVEYYKDNPNVTVIVERREGPDRRTGKSPGGKRELRDRRRRRIPGEFPETDAPVES